MKFGSICILVLIISTSLCEPQCDQTFPVPIEVNITVGLQCVRNQFSQFPVYLDIHTVYWTMNNSDSNALIASDFDYFGNTYKAVSKNLITFSLADESDMWFSYCNMTLYSGSNQRDTSVIFNRTCFVAESLQSNHTNSTQSTTSGDGNNPDELTTHPDDDERNMQWSSGIILRVLVPSLSFVLCIGIIVLSSLLVVKYCKLCGQENHNCNVVANSVGVHQLAKVDNNQNDILSLNSREFDASELFGEQHTFVTDSCTCKMSVPIECTENNAVQPAATDLCYVFVTINPSMPISETTCIVGGHCLYTKGSNRYLVIEEASEAIQSFNDNSEGPTRLGKRSGIRNDLPQHQVHRHLVPPTDEETETSFQQAASVFNDLQSNSVDQNSLDYQSFINMESIPSIKSVLVSGITQDFNAASQRYDQKSCDIALLDGTTSSRDSKSNLDSGGVDEIGSDAFVTLSHPIVDKNILQWFDCNGDPVTSPGLLNDGFLEISLESSGSGTYEKKGVHWLLYPYVQDMRTSARNLLSPNPPPFSNEQDYVPPLDKQPFLLKLKMKQWDMCKQKAVCCEG